MEAFGATVTDVPSDGGRITEGLIKAMIATSPELAARPGHWWCDQLNNHDATQGYVPMGEEIWRQSDGQVDAFVHAVGTAHSIHGVAQVPRAHLPDISIIAVEPAESAVLSGGPSGSHRIEGIGIGFLPRLWQPAQVDGIEQVSTARCMGDEPASGTRGRPVRGCVRRRQRGGRAPRRGTARSWCDRGHDHV